MVGIWEMEYKKKWNLKAKRQDKGSLPLSLSRSCWPRKSEAGRKYLTTRVTSLPACFRHCTASSWRNFVTFAPFTDRIASPTYKDLVLSAACPLNIREMSIGRLCSWPPIFYYKLDLIKRLRLIFFSLKSNKLPLTLIPKPPPPLWTTTVRSCRKEFLYRI